jgi:hypothetical protein
MLWRSQALSCVFKRKRQDSSLTQLWALIKSIPNRETGAVVLIREHTAKVIDGEIVYAAWIYGEQRADGAWEGWLEFHPVALTNPP